MTYLRITLTSMFPIIVVATTLSPVTAQSFTMEEYRRLHNELQTSDQEPWRTIPWTTSLLVAQHEAVAAQKPIFIWAMDGHPLGCT